MNRIFSSDSPFMTFVNKLGQVIIINLMWLVGCIPIITIGTSTIAMYYAIVKTVRAECGYSVKEFWRAYRMNLVKGILLLILIAVCVVLIYINRQYMSNLGSAFGLVMFVIYDILAVILAVMLAYAVPVLSRFTVKPAKYISMIFTMSFRHLLSTVGVLAGTVGIIILISFFPITVLFAPGVWCFCLSFLVEKAMREYMPDPEEGCEPEWYYDLTAKKHREEED